MASESKLLKLFRLLLGDKYKIVPLSDEEKSKTNDAISDEDLDAIAELVSDVDKSSKSLKDEDLPHYSNPYGLEDNEPHDQSSISAEAQALFERDKQKYGISALKKEEYVEPDRKDLIAEAQIAYDEIVGFLSSEIQRLNDSKMIARESYLDIINNNDKDDPYRAQMADKYNPLYIQEQIDYYNRIKQDPFYGRFKVLSQNGKSIDVYIGRIAFEENGITIVSPWSDVGKAFRQNRANFYIKGEYYSVINKYTYITQNGKIVGVKDESPR